MSFPRAPGFRAEDLLPNAAQDEARAWLARTSDWPLGRLVVWGASGSGKSHLLHAWAETQAATVLPAAPAGWPRGPLAIDSIDTVADEIALLHLLNAAAESRHPVLLAATTPPGRLPVRLPDLASRLRATTAVRIGPAADDFLRVLLARLLAERQLRVPADVQSFLLARLTRTPAALRAAVARLDAAALEQKHRIDRAFAADILRLRDISVPDAPGTSPAPPGIG